jgi:tRNA(Arg) A34 adenosine deaminase TadA
LAGDAIAGKEPREIVQPVRADKEGFMGRALTMRRLAIKSGDQPFGAVIVKDGKIVGEGPSRVIVRHDPTAHGEMEAIRDAARRLKTNVLHGCVLYTTAKPCPMCETAAYWANLSRTYYGAEIRDGGAPRYPSC